MNPYTTAIKPDADARGSLPVVQPVVILEKREVDRVTPHPQTQSPVGVLQDVAQIPLLGRGVVSGMLRLYVSADRPATELREAAARTVIETIERMLASPVLIAQADANAQWLRRAKRAAEAESIRDRLGAVS